MKIWSDFISSQKIQPLQNSNTLSALDETSLLYVGGEDATDFLQNQLSNDINKIDEKSAQLSSFSNAKGRMLGIFRVIKIDGGYLLVLPKSILPTMQQQLQKFIIMSKVILADITDQFALFTVVTDQQELLSNVIYPTDINQVYQSESLISIHLPGSNNQSRFLMLSNNAEEAIDLWTQLSQNLQINDSSSWKLQDIEAGIPTLYPATVGAFVLQMSNLQLIGGVSFKKGCYPGQEVVARMQYLGKLKRRMYLAEVKTSQCPKPGDELTSKQSDKPDGSGKVVDSIQISADLCLLLFIAQIDKTKQNQLVLAGQPDKNITLKTLPYSIVD
ncbi:MAG: folate-binding protein YgfZ [Gammaproteobacteria bacterium]|nr:folate-binding protein YgfZ [Gammaproteobacteria bacterium]